MDPKFAHGDKKKTADNVLLAIGTSDVYEVSKPHMTTANTTCAESKSYRQVANKSVEYMQMSLQQGNNASRHPADK